MASYQARNLMHRILLFAIFKVRKIIEKHNLFRFDSGNKGEQFLYPQLWGFCEGSVRVLWGFCEGFVKVLCIILVIPNGQFILVTRTTTIQSQILTAHQTCKHTEPAKTSMWPAMLNEKTWLLLIMVGFLGLIRWRD